MAAEPSKPAADKASPAAPAQPTEDKHLRVVGEHKAGFARAVKRASMRQRHRLILLSFYLMVAAPVTAAFLYLYGFAADQFQSTSAFSVRKQDFGSAISVFGGLTDLSSGTSDNEVIYQYIQSQNMVEAIDKDLDLRSIWSTHQGKDPFFSVNPEATIEDLLTYWSKMVIVRYDSTNGSLSLQTRAFTADDAVKLNEAVLTWSSQKVEDMSRIAQDDAIKLAREELATSSQRLKEARVAMATFRRQNQIIDPSTSYQSQMAIMNGLEQQLVSALVERDLLAGTVKESDPRLLQIDRKIGVIKARIAKEQSNVGADPTGSTMREGAMPDDTEAGGAPDPRSSELYKMVGNYEALLVDQEFAQKAYTTALVGLDEALADAKRKSRYLVAHILPTHPQSAELPHRFIIGSVLGVMDFLAWVLLVLIAYSLRDRR